MSEKQEFYTPQIPRDLYQSNTAAPLQTEDIITYISTNIEYIPHQGIIVHILGATYPKKGFPTPEAVAALNIYKATLRQLSHYPVTILTLFLFGSKTKLLNTLSVLFQKAMAPHTIKDEYLCPTAYNILHFTKKILISLGIPQNIAYSFANSIAHIIEYDDAYRYRLQDLLDETTKQALVLNPRKEIKRLLTIHRQRDISEVPDKVDKLIKPLLYLLLLPKYKKLFIKNIDHIIAMKYDSSDRYWAYLKNDNYQFGGRPYEIRTIDLKIPQAYKVTQ